MSVINQMLQDLEQRRYQEVEAGSGKVIEGMQPTNGSCRRNRLFWWLAGASLIVLMGGIGWGYANLLHDGQRTGVRDLQLPPVIEPVPQPAIVTETPPEPPSAAVPVEPVSIETGFETQPPQTVKRIELHETDRGYDLELEFNQPLLLPPLHYRQGEQLWLQLFETEASQLQLPGLQEQTPIQAWQAYLEAGQQMIRLQLDPSYQAELSQTGPQVWVLQLRQARKEPVAQKQTRQNQAQVEQLPRTTHRSGQKTQADKPTGQAAVQVKKNEDGFSQAQQALANGQRQQAERLLKRLLVQQPGHLAASLLLSQLYLSQNAPQQAEPVILAALQAHPDQPDLITHFTHCLVAEERLNEAADYLLKTMHGDYAPHLGLLATIRQRQQQHRQARDYFLRALRLNPQEVTWLAGLGISQEQLGEMDEARQAYRSALSSRKLNLTLKDFVEGRLSAMKQIGD
jgi:tetratricopeptide (TPR) repeat protein